MSLLQLPNNPTFSVSPLCESFTGGMGTQVQRSDAFIAALIVAMAKHDTSNDRCEGQYAIRMDPSVINDAGVSCGVGPASEDASRYHSRCYRGKVSSYLKREYAAAPESVTALVYSAAAWNTDPQVIEYGLAPCEGDYCIVGVRAEAGPDLGAFSAARLVANLAGGNNEAKLWTADEIRELAAKSVEFYSKWSTVCD